MPSDDSLGLDDEQCRSPAAPESCERAIPIGIDPRDSSVAEGHGGSAAAPRADVGGQESQLAALHEFERLAEQKKTTRE
jgi:hypothetical protein